MSLVLQLAVTNIIYTLLRTQLDNMGGREVAVTEKPRMKHVFTPEYFIYPGPVSHAPYIHMHLQCVTVGDYFPSYSQAQTT